MYYTITTTDYTHLYWCRYYLYQYYIQFILILVILRSCSSSNCSWSQLGLELVSRTPLAVKWFCHGYGNGIHTMDETEFEACTLITYNITKDYGSIY